MRHFVAFELRSQQNTALEMELQFSMSTQKKPPSRPPSSSEAHHLPTPTILFDKSRGQVTTEPPHATTEESELPPSQQPPTLPPLPPSPPPPTRSPLPPTQSSPLSAPPPPSSYSTFAQEKILKTLERRHGEIANVENGTVPFPAARGTQERAMHDEMITKVILELDALPIPEVVNADEKVYLKHVRKDLIQRLQAIGNRG